MLFISMHQVIQNLFRLIFLNEIKVIIGYRLARLKRILYLNKKPKQRYYDVKKSR